MTNKEFARLLDKLQKKDIKALKIIYEQYFQKIYNSAYGILKNRDNAYDVAMNVMMKLIEYPSNPYLIDNHIGLLISMTKNESVDFIRKESRHINSEAINEIAPTATQPDNLWLEDILNTLTDDETVIFIEHCIWGKKLKDIAVEKNIPYITVKRRYANIKIKVDKLYN